MHNACIKAGVQQAEQTGRVTRAADRTDEGLLCAWHEDANAEDIDDHLLSADYSRFRSLLTKVWCEICVSLMLHNLLLCELPKTGFSVKKLDVLDSTSSC